MRKNTGNKANTLRRSRNGILAVLLLSLALMGCESQQAAPEQTAEQPQSVEEIASQVESAASEAAETLSEAASDIGSMVSGAVEAVSEAAEAAGQEPESLYQNIMGQLCLALLKIPHISKQLQ